jgi:hypothetical protein
MLFSISVNILLSKNNSLFSEDKDLKLNITKDIGEGSYGKVFEFNDQYAIKIFKDCTIGNINLSSNQESILPESNENRELQFYFEMLKKNKKNNSLSINYILQPYAIGYTTQEFFYKKKFDKNTYFVILPLCIPFYKLLPIKNVELISLQKENELFKNISIQSIYSKPILHTRSITFSNNTPITFSNNNTPIVSNQNKNHIFGILFVLQIMKKICKASVYLEEEFKIFNLDFKISNIMFLKPNPNDYSPKNNLNTLNDLIVIDFGLVKYIQDLNSIFQYDDVISQKYFIWPYSGTTLLSNIPAYSICINGLELLFGKKEIDKLPSYRFTKKIIEKIKNVDHNLYTIFYEGLMNKCNTRKLLHFIQKYLLSILG